MTPYRKHRGGQSKQELTRADRILARLKNHTVLATLVVLTAIITGAATATDALSKLISLGKQVWTATRPQYRELLANVTKYAIDAQFERLDYTGPVVITPVALFRDPHSLADGSPSGYTYLLTRFTNMSSAPVTVGALVNERGTPYRLDDPQFGYQPTIITLYQLQMFFRGKPMKPDRLNVGVGPDSIFGRATIPAHSSRYAYINSLTTPWPSVLALTVIDVTDNPAGTVRIKIAYSRQKPKAS